MNRVNGKIISCLLIVLFMFQMVQLFVFTVYSSYRRWYGSGEPQTVPNSSQCD